MKERIEANTIIRPLLSGAYICDHIHKIIKTGNLLPVCVYVASPIKGKGVVEHNGEPGKNIMGSGPLHSDFVPEHLYRILKDSGIIIEYTENTFPEVWTKLLFIVSFESFN